MITFEGLHAGLYLETSVMPAVVQAVTAAVYVSSAFPTLMQAYIKKNTQLLKQTNV